MSTAVLALVIAIIGCAGALYAIFKGVFIATKPPVKRESLPPGQYKMTKVEGTEDVYDLELVKEEK